MVALGDLPGWFIAAATYSGAAALVVMLYGSGQRQSVDPTGRKPGCKGCGK